MFKKIFSFIDNLILGNSIENLTISSTSYDNNLNFITIIDDNLDIDSNVKDFDRLSYHADKLINSYKDLDSMDISKYYSSDRYKNDIILVNILDLKFSFSKHGAIYAFSKTGKIGVFYYNLKDSYLFIDDMLPDITSHFISRRALEFMEQIALKYNVYYIKGLLSPIDIKDHRDRLIKLYAKNGFTINATETKIEKCLKINK